MNLKDAITVSGVRRTADGYLVADARVARTGVQQYLGSEVGKPDMPIVRVYRPESSVFAADAMRSYAHRPVTVGHPGQDVTADNWKEFATGSTGAEVIRDGEFVRVPLVLMDAAAIAEYESGTRELSMGYTADLAFADGFTPTGEAYDAVLTNLKMNHLALVDRARGGAALRIGDDNPTKEITMSTKTVLVDGLSVETTDAGAVAIDKLQKQIKDGESARQALTDAHSVAIAGKDADLAKKDAEIDTLKAKVLSDAEIDKRVNDRAALISTAKQIADVDYSGKADAEIRKAAVVAKLGDAAIAGKSEAYIAARFDMLIEDGSDPVAAAIKANDGTQNDPAGKAYTQMIADMQSAHRAK